MLQTDHAIRIEGYSKGSSLRFLFSCPDDKIFFLICSIYRNNTGFYGMGLNNISFSFFSIASQIIPSYQAIGRRSVLRPYVVSCEMMG